MAKKATRDYGAVKEVTTIRMSPDVKAALELAAANDDRSMSSLIQKIVTEWLKAKKMLK